ncbi:MAG: histidine--tRNA ligase [Thermoleophilaceae bacterium]
MQAPKGTFDVLPEEGTARRALLARAAGLLESAGYGYADTPVFEDTELFARGVGEATDIVSKEMFSFEDQGGRSLTLRPEGTAGLCRAYVQHGMHKLPQPVKLWYWGPFFRSEAPQAGRYRQFTQVGAEAIGSDDPSVDAELIALLADLLAQSGSRDVRLRISSLGSADTRHDYLEELRAFLRSREGELSGEVRGRIDLNPLRAFDAADPGTQEVMRHAPLLLDRLAPDDAEHFAEVRALLEDAGCGHEVDPGLVRGLDYYTRTVFEFSSDALGAQSGLGGGGRYDRLVEELGGPATPAVGWAAGIERILLAAADEGARPEGPWVFVARAPGVGGRAAFSLAQRLRAERVPVQMEQAGRSLKGQLKHADRVRARFAAIVGEEGIELKDLRTGDQRPVAGAIEIVEAVRQERPA